ncbi:Metallo-dependent phosphatase [Rhizoclosmatium globosum]|uniref:Metallo-dependent phosphatase n=1 Tax=Rhizoclosmatium globosum TaxID=329046 RepID=A0A1Y2BTB8_9FUNG|nr:Metallo-dependent phosphatase [Rhizoclosmatium globosum]|eukprot:ORY37986.1 Metallo-dependent phosphatase [Rhizoclosmatium globosum]
MAAARVSTYFDALVIGDWGNPQAAWTANVSAVASQMNTWAGKKGSAAIINVGDNFYAGDANGKYPSEAVNSATDSKWVDIWSNVYNGDNIKNLPWWGVLGNHDWYLKNSFTYELNHIDPHWVIPDLFYTKRVQVDAGIYATFIFIETDLMQYGYGGSTKAAAKGMQPSFAAQGWTNGTNTVEKQLAWIENAVQAANNDAYIFIMGHHPIYTCYKKPSDWNNDPAVLSSLKSLLTIVNKWNVSAYFNGHQHSLAGYVTNNGNTLQIQSGSGGQLDGTCTDTFPDTKTYTVGGEYLTPGFAHLFVNSSIASVDLIDLKGSVIASYSVAPRVPVTGVSADATYLTAATDPAVHFIKAAVPAEAGLDLLVIGDWGNYANIKDQKKVADVMDKWAAAYGSSAVLALGDNFYATANTSYNYEGVKEANDKKFVDLWSAVYSGKALSQLPWWMILGNHDWYLNNSQIYQMQYNHPNWQIPDFFYTKRVQIDSGVFASFIFIETDLLNYGWNSTKNDLGRNFKLQGWDATTAKKQLAWLDSALAAANNDQYVFVIGHHTGFACGSDVSGSVNMADVTALVNKWNATAYVNGHHHTFAYYYTNKGNTLQVQTGNGGNTDSGLCVPSSSAPGQELTNTYGFAHLRITATAAAFDFVTENNEVAFTASIGQRKPANAVADTTNLPPAGDVSIHFVDPLKATVSATGGYVAPPASALYSAADKVAASLVISAIIALML